MTASNEFQRLMNDARIALPGALDNVIQQELFNVLDEFLQGSSIWQEDIDFNTVVDDKTYTISSAVGGTIVRLMWVYNPDDVPVSAHMAIPGNLVLVNAPSQVEELTATVALTTIDPVDEDDNPIIPTWLLKKYRQGITAGVLGKMMAQPGKTYSNERLAVYHSRRFRNAISVAHSDAQRLNTYRAQGWRFPAFA